MSRGKFIVFEGLDGSGKTTQLNAVKNRFYAQQKQLCAETDALRRKKCLLEREPDDALIGLICRSALKGTVVLKTETQAMLHAAARFEHISNTVIPQLEKGNHVLCDRFYFSNFAYNKTDTLSIEDIISLNKLTMDKIKPDVTVYFKISPDAAAIRMDKDRAERELYEQLETQREVEKNYLRAFELLRERENIFIVDASMDEHSVTDAVWTYLRQNIFTTDEDFFEI